VLTPGYDSHRASWRTPCENALVVFDEIPPRRAPRSERFYIFYFAILFAFFPFFSALMWWVRWPHSLLFSDKVYLVGLALISLPSGLFLLKAKSVTPSDNQERVRGLYWAWLLVWVVLKVLEIRPR
jgi:Mn2+/Fe2+ NRAMP family transporter